MTVRRAVTPFKRRMVPLIVLLLTLCMAAPTIAQSDQGHEPSHEQNYEILINVPAFSLYLYQGGVQVRRYPIGIGKVLKPSVLGETEIVNRVFYPVYYPPNWYDKGLEPVPPGPDNPVGTRWLGLGFDGYGIHGTSAPKTVGTSASSGCIRMYNQDVEALADLVDVGTKVTLIYDTVETWRDPVSDRIYLRIYPDIYKKGGNTPDAVLAELRRLGAGDNIDRDFLQGLIDEAAGQDRPMPTSVPLTLDGGVITPRAVQYGGKVWLPLNTLAKALGDTLTWPSTAKPDAGALLSGRKVQEVLRLGKMTYAPLPVAAESLGLAIVDSSVAGVDVRQIRLIANHKPLEVRTYLEGQYLLVPVIKLAHLARAKVSWNEDLGAVIVDGRPIFGASVIGGEPYLPFDRAAALFGLKIDWSAGALTANVSGLD